ncbi:MAG: hypothetical protein ACLFWM_12570 [Actinomycetota bacterium]
MRRLAVMVMCLALAALMIRAAFAPLSDRGEFEYRITAADHFGDGDREEPGERVWVCRVVGPPGNLRVKEGENPIHVSVASSEALEAFAGSHPSYVVEEGEECVWPREGGEEGEEADPQSETESGEATEETPPPQDTRPPASDEEAGWEERDDRRRRPPDATVPDDGELARPGSS